jgi:hypothetical protein
MKQICLLSWAGIAIRFIWDFSGFKFALKVILVSFMFLGNLSSPENEPTLSEVEMNFLRITNLLTTICRSAVRVYFDKQIHPNVLKNILRKNYAMLDNLLRRRIITSVQWTLLFPSCKDKKSVQPQSSPVWNTTIPRKRSCWNISVKQNML